MQVLRVIAFTVGIAAGFFAVALWIRRMFRPWLERHRRGVRIATTSIVPPMLGWGATIAASGSAHAAARAAIGTFAAGWVTELCVRYIPNRRARPLPPGPEPDRDQAFRRLLRRF